MDLEFSSSNATVPFRVDIVDDGLTELSEFFETFVGLNMGRNCLSMSLEYQESSRINFARNRAQVVIFDSDREPSFHFYRIVATRNLGELNFHIFQQKLGPCSPVYVPHHIPHIQSLAVLSRVFHAIN